MKMFESNVPSTDEWTQHLLDTGQDPLLMSNVDFVESYVIHRRMNGGSVTNVWATIFFAYVFLTVLINVFPESFPLWVLNGFVF